LGISLEMPKNWVEFSLDVSRVMEASEHRWRNLFLGLIPVIVGAVIAATSSLLVLHYTVEAQNKATLRRERAEHIERATTLAARLLRDLNSSIALSVVNRRRGMSPEDVQTATAPADTLVELDAVIRLYLPELAAEVDAINKAYDDFTSKADSVITSEFTSASEPFDSTIQAGRQKEFRVKIEPLARPVVDRTYKLLHRLRQIVEQTSNHAMQRTADRPYA
jgi:hypothetical protein